MDIHQLIRGCNHESRLNNGPILSVDSGVEAILAWLAWIDDDYTIGVHAPDTMNPMQAWIEVQTWWDNVALGSLWESAGIAIGQRVKFCMTDMNPPEDPEDEDSWVDMCRSDGRIGWVMAEETDGYVDVLIPQAEPPYSGDQLERLCHTQNVTLTVGAGSTQTPGTTILLHCVAVTHLKRPDSDALGGWDKRPSTSS